MEVSISEQPIMYVNVSGDIDLMRLKKYADDLKDKLEELPQLNRVRTDWRTGKRIPDQC
jgi:hypothetical protein